MHVHTTERLNAFGLEGGAGAGRADAGGQALGGRPRGARKELSAASRGIYRYTFEI